MTLTLELAKIIAHSPTQRFCWEKSSIAIPLIKLHFKSEINLKKVGTRSDREYPRLYGKKSIYNEIAIVLKEMDQGFHHTISGSAIHKSLVQWSKTQFSTHPRHPFWMRSHGYKWDILFTFMTELRLKSWHALTKLLQNRMNKITRCWIFTIVVQELEIRTHSGRLNHCHASLVMHVYI